jgi:hypothetical protein
MAMAPDPFSDEDPERIGPYWKAAARCLRVLPGAKSIYSTLRATCLILRDIIVSRQGEGLVFMDEPLRAYGRHFDRTALTLI